MAFKERLARVLHELDREVLARQPVRFRGDPPDEALIPLSDDAFLYLRAGIVAAGRDPYERVLAEPAVLAEGEWDECEDLLSVAPEVVGDDIDTQRSYETGANEEHWTPRPEPEREPWDSGLRPVSIDVRDLLEAIEAERPSADGGWEPSLVHVTPRFLDGGVLFDISTDLARIVATNGGLPEQLAAEHVAAGIDVADSWHLEPVVGKPTPSEFGDHRELPVRVTVPTDAVRGWRVDQRRTGLAALAATCLLTVLPDQHAAVPELLGMREAGTALLPL